MDFSLKLLILITALILIFTTQLSRTIKCWDCRSDIDPRCADPFDNRTFSMTFCPSVESQFFVGMEATLCRKIRQKVHGVWKYFRSCAFLGEPGIAGDERFCLMRTGTYNIFMEYCTCNSKDGCNSSSRLKMSSLLIVLVLPIILLN
ncbi:hypothetical protein PPYR_13848 [Photinus pyralis]|uniref:Uncharacterized protein n=1 Tax=Photinus pyralis TaxID=7054 RepID=A0A5N4AAA5_PHOPY|nr:uncharacterized protein LOC116179112 [Photinus pyralis]XP_031354691.1 uncharacterized protein LOC116179116 [Photinus pyralis]KAB0794219.1 hypothetical protein PPYR_13839 [Photinus pyralis]KAB0794228.1 hypothetical protein PPYR_13848 [Photinus pyralis]